MGGPHRRSVRHHAAMDDATIRVAGADDLDELCRLRLAFIGDVRHVDPATFDRAFVDATRTFFVDAMQAGRVRSWLAVVGEHAVGPSDRELHRCG